MNEHLASALGDFYNKHVLLGQHIGLATQRLKQVIANDPDAKQEAEKRLAELNALAVSCNGDLSKRCFVSHMQRNAIEYALDNAPQEADMTNVVEINLSQYAKQQAENVDV